MRPVNYSKNEENLQKNILNEINDKELIMLAKDLINIPSVNPPGDEKKVAELLANHMDKIGLAVELEEVLPNRSNVIAKLEGIEGRPTLLFLGHTDVVPVNSGWNIDPFKAIEKEGKLYGRGSADMKGGLAAMVMVIETLKRSKVTLRGNLIFAAVIDEEVSSYGIRHLIKNGLKADYAIIGEPTDLKMAIAQKGGATFEIIVHGKAAHASQPHEGINAITKMANLINRFEQYSIELKNRKNPLLGSPTINFGTIHGGSKSNIVADKCVATLDRRLIPGETISQARKELEKLVEELKKDDPEFSVDIKELEGSINPCETPEDSIVVDALRSSIQTTTCKKAELMGFTAGTDAAFLENIPWAIFGPGSISQAHKADEYVNIEDLLISAKVYALTALNLLH